MLVVPILSAIREDIAPANGLPTKVSSSQPKTPRNFEASPHISLLDCNAFMMRVFGFLYGTWCTFHLNREVRQNRTKVGKLPQKFRSWSHKLTLAMAYFDSKKSQKSYIQEFCLRS